MSYDIALKLCVFYCEYQEMVILNCAEGTSAVSRFFTEMHFFNATFFNTEKTAIFECINRMDKFVH